MLQFTLFSYWRVIHSSLGSLGFFFFLFLFLLATIEDNYEILQLSRDDTNVSPEYYYANKKSTKSPSISSLPTPPSPPSPLLVDKNAASSWQLTKTLHRNGDVRKKRKNAVSRMSYLQHTKCSESIL